MKKLSHAIINTTNFILISMPVVQLFKPIKACIEVNNADSDPSPSTNGYMGMSVRKLTPATHQLDYIINIGKEGKKGKRRERNGGNMHGWELNH